MIAWTIRVMLAFEIAWIVALPPAWHCAPDGLCSRIEFREAGLVEDRR